MNDEKEPQGGGSNPWMKSLLIWVGILLALVLFVSMFDGAARQGDGTAIAYSDFNSRVKQGDVKSVVISGDTISGKLSNDQNFSTVIVNKDPGLVDRLSASGVEYRARAEEQTSFWMILLYQAMPFLLI